MSALRARSGRSTGVKMTHIPYRSVPQAQQAVMTSEVAAFFDTPITAVHADIEKWKRVTREAGMCALD